MKVHRCDAHRMLRESLAKLFACTETRLEKSAAVSWASATFIGERHIFDHILSGANALEAATRFEAALGTEEFEIPGHIVADIIVSAREARGAETLITIEALTVEAA
jgi:hypothetical protein